MKEEQFTDKDYLTEKQYKNAANLNARLYVHQHFSINQQSLQAWVFSHLNLPASSKILDLGCGPGDLWVENQKAVPKSWEIIMADISPGMLVKAQENLKGMDQIIEYREVDAQEIPFEDETFDAVIAGHMLYHVPNIPKGLNEIRRVLKPGGKLFATTNGESHMKELHQLMLEIYPDYGFSTAAKFFGLENGSEILAPFFDEVSVFHFEDGLVITEVQPLINYITSMQALEETRLAAAARIIRKEIDANGAFRISKAPGIVVGRKGVIPKKGSHDLNKFVLRILNCCGNS